MSDLVQWIGRINLKSVKERDSVEHEAWKVTEDESYSQHIDIPANVEECACKMYKW